LRASEGGTIAFCPKDDSVTIAEGGGKKAVPGPLDKESRAMSGWRRWGGARVGGLFGALALAASLVHGGQCRVYDQWPFDAAEAKRRQQATARALGAPVEQNVEMAKGVRLTLVLIPAGEFMMGSAMSAQEIDKRWPGGRPDNYTDEQPRHRVRITRPFYLGKCEVTRGQFAAFVKETRYRTDAEKTGEAFGLKNGRADLWEGISWRNPGFAQSDDHPVVSVSWNDAKAFCDWISRKSGKTLSLPTEAQSEYACRAGSDGIWPWGDKAEDARGKANVAGEVEEVDWTYKFKGVRDGHTYTAAVASFGPNAFGLHETIGNVFEWCSDRYGQFYYKKSPLSDPTGPADGLARVLRGGCFLGDPRICRASYRFREDPTCSAPYSGFRVSMTLR